MIRASAFKDKALDLEPKALHFSTQLLTVLLPASGNKLC